MNTHKVDERVCQFYAAKAMKQISNMQTTDSVNSTLEQIILQNLRHCSQSVSYFNRIKLTGDTSHAKR